MGDYYISAKIAKLDLGAKITEENPYMAAIAFKETYNHLLNFGNHKLEILGVESI